MEKITAVIITHNEERNIGRCLQSLQGVADDVVVVDSGSTDATESICRAAGVHFEYHDWEGYSGQKNYANSLVSDGWILSLDADEALSVKLRESLLAFKQSYPDKQSVYSFNRLTNYCGHWIHHCGWYPDSAVRLFPAGTVRWDGLVHERLVLHSPFSTLHLRGDLLHYSYYSVEEHAQRQVHYASLAARKAYESGKRVGACGVWLRPGWNFIRNYFFKEGFMDGHAGYTVCRMAAFYTFIKYALLREYNHHA